MAASAPAWADDAPSSESKGDAGSMLLPCVNLCKAKGIERKAPLRSSLQTYFISSGSSLSSFVGVILIPLFLARGQPDRLWLKREERPVSLAESLHLLFPRFSHLSLEFGTVFLISLVLQLHITRRSQEKKKIKKLREMDSN